MARTPRARTTIRGIKAANERINHHWFSNDAMSFFNTIICTGVIVMENESYFIASNQYIDARDSANDGPRFYVILHATHGGEVHSVGKDAPEGGYPSLEAARAAFGDATRQDRYCLGWEPEAVPSEPVAALI